MLNDLLCLLRHRKTRFGLMEKHQISLMRIDRDGDEKEWSACSAKMGFDFGHGGEWAEGDTPYEAMINCIRKIEV